MRIVRHHLEKEGWLMFLFAKLKMYLVAAGAVVAALSVAYLRGRSAEAKAEHERELNLSTSKRESASMRRPWTVVTILTMPAIGCAPVSSPNAICDGTVLR